MEARCERGGKRINDGAAVETAAGSAAWATTVDIFVILIALSLPWSTSLVAIFAAWFLGERPSLREWSGIALVAAGVLVLGFKR